MLSKRVKARIRIRVKVRIRVRVRVKGKLRVRVKGKLRVRVKVRIRDRGQGVRNRMRSGVRGMRTTSYTCKCAHVHKQINAHTHTHTNLSSAVASSSLLSTTSRASLRSSSAFLTWRCRVYLSAFNRFSSLALLSR